MKNNLWNGNATTIVLPKTLLPGRGGGSEVALISPTRRRSP